ncbi:MAG: CDP-alcohol phosphatidyltransferase family protein [Limnochordaceae bacterium]|nr:CDP-alcohol phosphatidyltransferase family protein [Limnochordaceae bacterium]
MDRLDEATRREELWREWFLARLLDRIPPWVRPDHLTEARLLLVIAAAITYLLHRDFRWQLALLVLAALTDLVDGPLARRRGLVHAEGARLDQRADTLLGVWLGILTLEAAALPLWVVAALLISQLLVWAAELTSSRWLTERSASLAGSVSKPVPSLSGLAVGPTVPKPNVAGRIQFVCVISGFLAALSSARLGWPLHNLGVALLLLAVAAAATQVSAKISPALGVHEESSNQRPPMMHP